MKGMTFMDNERTPSYPEWNIVRKIGSGGFGTVYEISRDKAGITEHGALKYISIPFSKSEIDDLKSEGYDDPSITKTFEGRRDDILQEYRLMQSLSGNTNIVNCHDVRDIQHDDDPGWDIFIRMELLTPLTQHLGTERSFSDDLIIRIGLDLSNALTLCENRSILHRDIKPQNIFVSENGDYKLGDFGIARIKEGTETGTVRIGTYDYMAPEVYYGRKYGKTIDMYSLGLVMYWLLNGRRGPFLPLGTLPTSTEKEEARQRRMDGEQLPPPVHGSEALKRIVLKACAYTPEDRYQTAQELRAALEHLRLSEMVTSHEETTTADISEDSEPTVLLGHVQSEPDIAGEPTEMLGAVKAQWDQAGNMPSSTENGAASQSKGNWAAKKKPVLIATPCVAACIVAICVLTKGRDAQETTPPATEILTPTPAPTPAPTPKPTPLPTPSPEPTLSQAQHLMYIQDVKGWYQDTQAMLRSGKGKTYLATAAAVWDEGTLLYGRVHDDYYTYEYYYHDGVPCFAAVTDRATKTVVLRLYFWNEKIIRYIEWDGKEHDSGNSAYSHYYSDAVQAFTFISELEEMN